VSFEALKSAPKMRQTGVANSDELRRIAALPSYDWQNDPDIPGLSRALDAMYAKPMHSPCRPRCGHEDPQAHLRDCQECARAYGACVCRGYGEMHLRPVQAAALQAIHDYRGGIISVRVGGGKTIVGFLAGTVCEVERVLLLVPASLQSVTMRTHAQLRKHWQCKTRIHVMSYELLSRDRGLAELRAFRPDLLIADEAQALKHPRAACTKRVHRHLRDHPDCGYVDMTGTITSRSIMEYHHRVMWAIEDGLQPLPREYPKAKDWAYALDEKIPPLSRKPPGALLRLCSDEEVTAISRDMSRKNVLENVRTAYGRRFQTAPGIVCTEDMFDGAMAISITGHEPPVSDAVKDAFRQLRETWCLPDGHPIDSPMDLWRHTRTLVQGMYYRWEPAPPADWLMARKIWSSTVRDLLRAYKDLDTPLMAVRDIDAGRFGFAKEALHDWRAIRDTYSPTTVATWIDDSYLKWIVNWATNSRGIIWTIEVAVAEAIARAAGIPYYGRGGICGKKCIEDETGSCVASIAANHKGRNLQYHHSKNLIVSIPPRGGTWEQMLGRTHRDGQEADAVTVDVLLGCYEQWEVFRQACRDAAYIEATTRQQQKLCFADIDIVSDEEILRRNVSGDPLWAKANATFFDTAGNYRPEELKL
jgi:hypothetical protein